MDNLLFTIMIVCILREETSKSFEYLVETVGFQAWRKFKMIFRSSSSRIRASNVTNENPLPPHEKKRKRASAAAANNKKPHLEKVRNEDISSYNLEKGPDRQLLQYCRQQIVV